MRTHHHSSRGALAAAASSGGSSLAMPVRRNLEGRFGEEFGDVRVHADTAAALATRAAGARALAFGRHLYFGAGQFDPATRDGRRLIAHELAHVVQQRRGAGGGDPEAAAERAAGQFDRGATVDTATLGGAPVGVYRQETTEEEPPAPESVAPVEVDPEETYVPGFGFVLPPPELLLAPPLDLTLPEPTFTPPELGSGEPIVLPEPPESAADEAAAPTSEAPSRLNLIESGSFNFGVRLGFPSPSSVPDPDAPPTAQAEALRQAQIIQQVITGRPPSTLELIDTGQLAGILWGIFSTHIAPDAARALTEGLSPSTGPGGVSAELDLVLITDFSNDIGGGLSFQLLF